MRRTPNHMVVQNTPKLHAVLSTAIEAFKPTSVLETGTYHGTGTTQVILSALGGRKVSAFHTIEVHPECYRIACDNLAGTPVKCHQGLSVRLSEAIEALTTDAWLGNPPEDVAMDGNGDGRIYIPEVSHGSVEGLLYVLLPLARPLLCLDSAGGIGLLEFQVVQRLQPRPFLLFLDDVNHVKHYRSLRAILNEPERWRVWGFDMVDGWAVAEAL